MKYTNNLKLPQPIYDAIANDDYNPGNSDLTVTQLIQPIQMTKLQIEHKDELIEDISDNIYALMGKAIHYILEKAESIMPVERRLYMSVNDFTISGQFDRIALISKNGGFTGKVQDYKFTSVWEWIYGLNKEREEQLNCLACLLNVNRYKVNQLEVVMIFRDWQKSKAQYDKSYPQQQIAIIPVKLWSIDDQLAFIDKKAQQYKANEYSDCTQEERWNKGDKYAVMKTGRKTALRVFDGLEKAQKWMDDNQKGDGIDIRKGENKRCELYCNVKNFCPQYLNK